MQTSFLMGEGFLPGMLLAMLLEERYMMGCKGAARSPNTTSASFSFPTAQILREKAIRTVGETEGRTTPGGRQGSTGNASPVLCWESFCFDVC